MRIHWLARALRKLFPTLEQHKIFDLAILIYFCTIQFKILWLKNPLFWENNNEITAFLFLYCLHFGEVLYFIKLEIIFL